MIIAMWDCIASIKLLKKEDVLSETKCEGVIRYTHLLFVRYSPCSFIDLKKVDVASNSHTRYHYRYLLVFRRRHLWVAKPLKFPPTEPILSVFV